MPFLRVQDDTKKKMDELFERATSKDPHIKTYDDLQKLLLAKIEPPDYVKLIHKDFKQLRENLCLYYDNGDHEMIEKILWVFEEVILDLGPEKADNLHKLLSELDGENK